MSLSKQEFTDAGRSMLGRAQNSERLTITKIVIGSGVKSAPADLWPLTALVAKEMDVTISATRDYGNGVLLVEGSFRNDQAPRIFQLREVGVMAHIAAEADRLYSVANAFADPVDTIDPASPAVQSFKIKLVIDRIPASMLTISIGPSENVLGSNIGSDTVGPGWYKDAAGNILNFKRIVEGTGMDIHDSTDGNSVYVGVSTLQNDLDLYVPLNYPSPPAGAPLFATVQAAHDYLLGFVIPPDKFARIHVNKGVLHHNGITFSHPNARQISLLGWPRRDLAVTQIGYMDTDTKLVYCATSGFAAGDILYIPNVLGWVGGCKVQVVRAGYLECSIVNRSGKPPYSVGATGSYRLSQNQTVLVYDTPVGLQGNVDCPNGIQLIKNITVQKGYAGFQIGGSRGDIQDCMALECTRGVNVYGFLCVLLGENCFTDCDNGLAGTGILTGFEYTYINGCGNGMGGSPSGFGMGGINAGMTQTAVYISHCLNGIYCFDAGNMRCGAIIYDTNAIGMRAEKSSIILAGPIGQYPSGNTTDLSAQGMSYIEYTKGPAHPAAALITSPAVEVVGNQNSLIHILP